MWTIDVDSARHRRLTADQQIAPNLHSAAIGYLKAARIDVANDQRLINGPFGRTGGAVTSCDNLAAVDKACIGLQF